jgi:hypothetical protein
MKKTVYLLTASLVLGITSTVLAKDMRVEAPDYLPVIEASVESKALDEVMENTELEPKGIEAEKDLSLELESWMLEQSVWSIKGD